MEECKKTIKKDKGSMTVKMCTMGDECECGKENCCKKSISE